MYTYRDVRRRKTIPWNVMVNIYTVFSFSGRAVGVYPQKRNK